MESLSTMDELDSETILEEINQALNQLSSGKAPMRDGIPADEVIKCSKGTLLKELHEIFANAGESKRGSTGHEGCLHSHFLQVQG